MHYALKQNIPSVNRPRRCWLASEKQGGRCQPVSRMVYFDLYFDLLILKAFRIPAIPVQMQTVAPDGL